MESSVMHHHVSVVAQNRQTLVAAVGEGEEMGGQLAEACNLAAKSCTLDLVSTVQQHLLVVRN